MKRFAIIAIMVLAPLTWGSAAEGADTCFGMVPNVIGTYGDDKIVAGYNEASINGRSIQFPGSYIVILTKGGNDDVHVDEDTDNPAFVCTGDGNDSIHGGGIWKVHAGSGYDKASLTLCIETPVFKVEAATLRPQGECK